ncbi:MATE family efflux transporter [Faunimonas sp. B44]|uniref:MATE family efflux transporter n=1 Tax=Faunimonas sp. B44 TaxID=3461493 RepID=UPI0040448554
MAEDLGRRAAGPVRPFTVTHAGVLKLALPMTLAYISTPLVGVVDTAVIGQLGQAALIGGIAVAAIIFDLFFTTFNFLRGGTTGLTAQALGAEDRAEEQAVLFRALLVAIVAGTLMVLLRAPFAALGFGAMGVDGEVLAAGRLYFDVRVLSSPFALANYVILGWMLGRGRSGTGLALQTLLNGTNIGLNLLFVLGLGWGVAGVAWATVAAEVATALVGLGLAWRSLSPAHRPSAARVFDLAKLKRTAALNTDMMVRSFSLLFAFAFFTRQSAQFGPEILAANAILMHFFMTGSYFLDGLAAAAEHLAGRAVGARYRPAFERTVRLTIGWGLAVSTLVAALYVLAGGAIIDLMTTAPEVREAARAFLPWAALTPPAAVVAFQMDGIFIGATWSRDMRNMMLLSVVIYLVAWAALVPVWGNHGLWAALLVFLGARSLTFRWRMRRLLPRTFPA